MKILRSFLFQALLVLAALIAVALLMPLQLSQGIRTLQNIFRQDYFSFQYSFNHYGWLLFMVLRILPLVITIALFIRIIVKKKSSKLFRRAWLLNFAIYFLAFGAIETTLRLQGNTPGSFYKNFSVTNKLVYQDIILTDSTGINILNVKSPFLPKDYIINERGFRSKYEFDKKTIDSLRNYGHKIIMVIGDSHTEGMAARPIENCFVDQIDRSSNYNMLNFGIVGTDPLQYDLLAQKFVPLLKPDLVLVICCSNDIMQYDRLPTPGIPIWFKTNAGGESGWLASQKPIWLNNKPNDVFKTAGEAYSYYAKHFTINYSSAPLIQKAMGQLVLTTKIFECIRGDKTVSPPALPSDSSYTFTHQHLSNIEHLCTKSGVPLMFVFIPEYVDFGLSATNLQNKYNVSFHSLNMQYFTNYEKSLRVGNGDPHFNNQGHMALSKYVIHQLDSIFAH